jgi:penicillin amidase
MSQIDGRRTPSMEGAPMRTARTVCFLLLAGVSVGFGPCPKPGPVPPSNEIPGLTDEVRIITDVNGVRHFDAANDFDLALAQGYVHCRDRLFQMDQTRRQVDGTESELLGPGRLESDIQARIVGLHRAAQRSFDAAPPRFQAVLQAYADGVNHCIDQLEASDSLPPEYALLELTSVRPWTAVDSLKIGKAISASLSLDIDTGLTEDLFAYIDAGLHGGFNGQLFFSADVFRSAPMDPASTVPDATNGFPFVASVNAQPKQMLARAEAVQRANEKLMRHPLFELALDRRSSYVGSNEWGVVGRFGLPIIANDPHLSLNIPSTFYELHLVVTGDPEEGPMNVSGVGFPGAPGVILGQNRDVTWGATTNPMDVADVFVDKLLVAQPACLLIGALACIESPPGVFRAVEIQLGVQYFFNAIGDSVNDNLVMATGLPPEATTIGTVPFRSFGPIIDITDVSVLEPPFGVTDALVLQYTGFHATQELQTFSIWNRAGDLDEFRDGLDKFDVGSQNWAYADRHGNLAYFSSAELPLRTDLEGGAVENAPPYLVRTGTDGQNNWIEDPARSQGQTIPFAILPYEEMPQTVNPENGYFVNANNDPAGTSLDNDPLNQYRTSDPGAIYYLNSGYANGLRAGRIDRLIQQELAGDGVVSTEDMKRMQANTQQLDAELLVPFLLNAFASASAAGAPPELAALAGDAGIVEAVGRLGTWGFDTPTGIEEGYDASDRYGFRRPVLRQAEIDASVAATIYNMWRGFAIRNVVHARLASLGIPNNRLPGSSESIKAFYNILDQSPYTGMAAAGIDWIPEPAALSAEDRRDLALLQALRDALDQLASPALAAAFGQSTDQEDYRWGRLHRIRFDHPFHDPFDIPPQAGFESVSPDLFGVARDGGFEVVNASGFSATAIGVNDFDFGGGPVRRYVGKGVPFLGPVGVNVVPGGPSGIPGDPDYATQLGTWLTADYHPVNMTLIIPGGDVEILVPPVP